MATEEEKNAVAKPVFFFNLVLSVRPITGVYMKATKKCKFGKFLESRTVIA